MAPGLYMVCEIDFLNKKKKHMPVLRNMSPSVTVWLIGVFLVVFGQ